MRVTVLVDNREQRPLLFPATLKWYPERGGRCKTVLVKTKGVVLSSGDYALEGHEEGCLIERKASIDELANNLLSNDYARANAAFGRFAGATENPYLLLECTASELRSETRWTKQPERIVDALAALIQRLKLRLLLCGSCKTPRQKRVVGELVLRLMMAHAFHKEVDYEGVGHILSHLGRGSNENNKGVKDEARERERKV